MNAYTNLKRKRLIKKLSSVALVAILSLGVLGAGASSLLGSESVASTASSSSVAVYLFAKVNLKDGTKAYAAQDVSGNKYAVEVVGTGMSFENGSAAFVKITQRDGRWHVAERLPTQGL